MSAREKRVGAPRAPLACADGASSSELPAEREASSSSSSLRPLAPTRRRRLWRSSISVHVCFVPCTRGAQARVRRPPSARGGTRRQSRYGALAASTAGGAPRRMTAGGTASTSGRSAWTPRRSPRTWRAGATCTAYNPPARPADTALVSGCCASAPRAVRRTCSAGCKGAACRRPAPRRSREPARKAIRRLNCLNCTASAQVAPRGVPAA